MRIHSSQTTHQSVELFGRQLQIMFLNWQTQMMMIVVIRTKLEFVISTEHVGSCRIIADQKEFGSIESACLLVRSVEPCCRQLVGAATHHLSGISKKTLHCVCVHCSWADTLAL